MEETHPQLGGQRGNDFVKLILRVIQMYKMGILEKTKSVNFSCLARFCVHEHVGSYCFNTCRNGWQVEYVALG
jgi:hypothetical protein